MAINLREEKWQSQTIKSYLVTSQWPNIFYPYFIYVYCSDTAINQDDTDKLKEATDKAVKKSTQSWFFMGAIIPIRLCN